MSRLNLKFHSDVYVGPVSSPGDCVADDAPPQMWCARHTLVLGTVMGILWGGSVSGTVTFVFSPMHGIHRKLGDFQAH